MPIISNQAQLKASDPSQSVWVSASAGSGKTKVLTDRVLRLLLAGVFPSKILCLTYTKAAAAEMQTRIHERLAAWVMLPEAGDDGLRAELQALTGSNPAPELLRQARQLFAQLLDGAPPMRIQTIHSFCQSVLARFPIEAGVTPAFGLLDERSADELLDIAKHHLLQIHLEEADGSGEDVEIKEALQRLSLSQGEWGFDELLRKITTKRKEFGQILLQPNAIMKSANAMKEKLEIDSLEMSQDDILQKLLPLEAERKAYLQEIYEAVNENGTAAEKKAKLSVIDDLLKLEQWDKDSFWQYSQLFLTKENSVRTKFLNKWAVNAIPHILEWAEAETQRVLYVINTLANVATARVSMDLLHVAEALLVNYDAQKRLRGVLDFDDVIFKTRDLLVKEGSASWVMYKLDGGIDHLLLDEAQDTSPEQWEITAALVEEFYSGVENGNGSQERTLFVVGDEKQSIYAFQGADVSSFVRHRQLYRKQADAYGIGFDDVPMTTSYRSAQGVLDVVDSVFAKGFARLGVVMDEEMQLQHEAFRDSAPSHIELLPLIGYDKEVAKQNDETSWPIPSEQSQQLDAKQQLAQQLAKTIAGWLKSGRLVKYGDPSFNDGAGRVIEAGDIMILVQKRGSFVGTLAHELKKHNVPVAGLDRMQLTDHIAVQDLLALGQFLLLPDDELNLACLLKSPLFGVSEDELFTLCHGRGEDSLWQRLRSYNEDSITVTQAKKELTYYLSQADFATPYQFYADVLYAQGGRKAFIRRMGEQVIEPLTVFLTEVSAYESQHDAPCLQGFMKWIKTGNSQVKRDMEQGANEVRIMTVHGSKGLQAPVVILPDTTNIINKQKIPKLLSVPKDNPAMILIKMILINGNAGVSSHVAELQSAELRRQEEEHHRLLYVAMTRAEDELYIAGHLARNVNMEAKGGEAIHEKSWYGLIAQGLQNLGSELVESQSVEEFGELPKGLQYEGEWLRYSSQDLGFRVQGAGGRVQGSGFRVQDSGGMIQEQGSVPDYLYQVAPIEPTPSKPLNPSRLDADAPAASSPLSNQNKAISQNAMERGVLIHRLLQILAGVSDDKREQEGAAMLKRIASSMTNNEISIILSEVLNVMHEPNFADIFGVGSMAEVPISGIVADGIDGILPAQSVISGQIDRLVVSDDRVIIVDFKTGKAPSDSSEVPLSYQRQMKAYSALLKDIYPKHEVKTALLYTSEPKMIEL